jgi:ATP-dependent DNA helicase RecG
MPVITLDQILAAAEIGEGTDWEFKSAKGGIPGNLWESYSAMANTDGGVIVLGVREGADQIHLDGLTEEQINRYQADLWNTLNNRGKVSVNLLRNEDMVIHPIDGGVLLSLRVPQANRMQKPVYLNGQPFGNTYRRQRDGDYHCQDAEVRRMFADAEQTSADARILEGFSLDDLDGSSLAQYRQRFRSAKGEHPWLAFADKELLEKLGGWRKDRQTGQEGITLAGLLMFGKDQVIRDVHAAPEYFVDYREILDPVTRWTDRIYPDGTWEANLFQFYQRVWPKLASGLPTPFQMKDGMRRDETPAHESLREAFVNALIHTDYSAPGGVVIERLPDRFIMANPGTLLVSQEQLRKGGVSECRNKALQQMFLMMGGGERAGSGVDKIRSGWKSHHWRSPMVGEQHQPDRVGWVLPMLSLIPDETLRALEDLFGREVVSGLQPPELQALATAQIEESVTNVRLRELLDEHPVDITRLLQGLCERGFLESDNRRRWTTYRLKGQKTQETSLFDTPSKENSQHSEGDSQHKEENSQHSAGDSQHSVSLPLQTKADPAHSAEEWQKIVAIAAPVAQNSRVSPEKTQEVIEQLCRGRFLTGAELAQLLDRHVSGLQQRFLNPMIKEGVLRYRFEKSSNRPDQAYTSAKAEAVE